MSPLLQEYNKKRDFKKTPEPPGEIGKSTSHLYLIQKHAASRLHYDFRLAMNGVLKSWAVPKGPSLNPADKRLAVHVEDHPINYGSFEGIIPRGEYGGGTVMMWDQGEWIPHGDPEKSYAKGHLNFELTGKRLKGRWSLIRMNGPSSENGKNWLLVKDDDDVATSKVSVVEKFNTSVVSKRSMEQIASNKASKTWHSNREEKAQEPEEEEETLPEKPKQKQRSVKTYPASASLPLARKAPFPSEFKPQLATLADHVPATEQWIHEVKYDGYRLIAFIQNGKVKLLTRNQLDWTDHFPSIAEGIERLEIKNAILDGEVVVQTKDGTTDFQALQNALKNNEKSRLVYYVFDLPYHDGYDLTQVPLIERKRVLENLLTPRLPIKNERIRFSSHIEGKGEAVFKNACHYALEGIVSKQIDSAYAHRRTTDWLKVKCSHRQEFVIGGYTEPKNSRKHFGSLLLGTYNDKGELVYNGHVGTGFSDALLATIFKQLQKRRQKISPFHTAVEDKLRRGVVWVKPELVAEVQFAGFTNENILRHPSFEGLREDKKAQEVRIERATSVPAASDEKPPAPPKTPKREKSPPSKGDPNEVAGIVITHPDRVLYPEQGVTKKDLCLYYEKISQWMLPHIQGRPLSLVRCPNGEGKACFFQKHFAETTPEAIRGIDIKEKSGTDTYILVDDVEGLVSLAQMSVLEFHPWPAHEKNIERPDRLIIDLDPAPGIKMAELVAGARLVRDRLADLGLISFVKTTGGKGLHVVAPVQPTLTWEEFKSFAAQVSNDIVAEAPHKYLATMSKAKREGKIFLDYFRNGRGATSVAPYSSRARKGATVSMPLSWDELSPRLRPDLFNVMTAPKRLQSEGDAWRGFFETKQMINKKLLQS